MTQHNIVAQPQRANNAGLDERQWVTQQHATTHDTTTTTTIQVNSVQRLNALLGALANQLPNVPSIIYGAWETPTQHRSVITQETYSHSKFLQELLRVLKTMPGYDSNFNFTTLEILFNGEFGQGRDLNHHGALLVTTIGDNKGNGTVLVNRQPVRTHNAIVYIADLFSPGIRLDEANSTTRCIMAYTKVCLVELSTIKCDYLRALGFPLPLDIGSLYMPICVARNLPPNATYNTVELPLEVTTKVQAATQSMSTETLEFYQRWKSFPGQLYTNDHFDLDLSLIHI